MDWRRMLGQNGRNRGDLEDPLVHDDDGDVEAPPLEDGEHSAQGAQAGCRLVAVLHFLLLLLLRMRKTRGRRCMGPGSSASSAANPVTSPHRRGGEEELVEWEGGREQPGRLILVYTQLRERERDWIQTAIRLELGRSTEKSPFTPSKIFSLQIFLMLQRFRTTN